MTETTKAQDCYDSCRINGAHAAGCPNVKPAPQVVADRIILRCYTCIEFNRKFHTHSITEASVLPGDVAAWANLHKSAGHDVREMNHGK